MWAWAPLRSLCRPCLQGRACPGHPLGARARILMWTENERGLRPHAPRPERREGPAPSPQHSWRPREAPCSLQRLPQALIVLYAFHFPHLLSPQIEHSAHRGLYRQHILGIVVRGPALCLAAAGFSLFFYPAVSPAPAQSHHSANQRARDA